MHFGNWQKWRSTIAALAPECQLSIVLAFCGVIIPVVTTALIQHVSLMHLVLTLWLGSSVEAVILAPMVFGVAAGHRLLPQGHWPRQILLLILVAMVGLVGSIITTFIANTTFLGNYWPYPGTPFLEALGCRTTMAALVVGLVEFRYRNEQAIDALHTVELQQLAGDRELSLARLQVLNAQIEPHFLFNSLANVRRLLRTDAPAAGALLKDLLRYFEEALPRGRDDFTTLGAEAEMVRAFLAVHKVRMGERLCVEVDVPADLKTQVIPPLALLTLVENALKHGLQPLSEGGTIRIGAFACDGMITLTVADTGCGMGSGSGNGTGLANLRARLNAMYGGPGSLSLHLNEPRGLIATIAFPKAA